MKYFLNGVCTFAVANKILGTSPAYLNKLVQKGQLVENLHYIKSERNCLITREAIERIAKIKGLTINLNEAQEGEGE